MAQIPVVTRDMPGEQALVYTRIRMIEAPPVPVEKTVELRRFSINRVAAEMKQSKIMA